MTLVIPVNAIRPEIAHGTGPEPVCTDVISDGEGLAVIGSPTAVEAFLASEGLASTDLALPRLSEVIGGSAAGVQAGAEIAANSGRWMKLTKESAEAVKKYGLVESKTPGVSHAMAGKPGDIKQWIQVVKGPGSIGANPAVLSGAAGIMAQLAMQQAMAEITDYLVTIDQKLDDVLRAQKDAVLADVIGVDLVIEEAMTVREHAGPVRYSCSGDPSVLALVRGHSEIQSASRSARLPSAHACSPHLSPRPAT